MRIRFSAFLQQIWSSSAQLERAGLKYNLSWSILTEGYKHLEDGRLPDLQKNGM